jgi:tape measure domain-containing protein
MAVGAKIGDLFFDVSADVGKAAAGIPAAGAKLGASMTRSIGGAVSKSIGVITAPIISGFETAAAAGVGIFGAVLTTGFGRLRAIDDAQGKLRALGHTTEEVAAIMDSALQAVIGTQYNMGEAATIAASAVAAGIKPGMELTKYLQLIADTATVSGLSLEQAGAIINKTTAFQRVYLREINQLANKGIPIFTWLQKEYGVTGDKLREMVSEGKVDAETFQRVIQENIGGAALKFGLSTFSGGLKNTFAAMGRLGEQLLGPFFHGLRDFGFPAMIKFFDQITEIVKPAMADLVYSAGFASFVDFFKELPNQVEPFFDMLKNFGPLIAPLTAFFGATGLGQLKNFLGPFGAFLPKINPILAAFVGLALVSKPLRDGIMDVVHAIGELFSGVDAGGGAKGLNSLIQLIGEGLGGALSYAAEWILKLKGPLASITPFISEVVRAFSGIDEIGANAKGGGFAANLKKDIAGVSGVATKIGLVLRDVVNAVVDAWPMIQDVVTSALSSIGKAIRWTVDNVIPVLVAAFHEVVDWVVKNWPMIKQTAVDVFNRVREVINEIVQWIRANWPGIRDTIINVFNAVVTYVRDNWPQVRDTVVGVITAIRDAIGWFAENILPHLVEGFRAVATFVAEIWPKIQNTIVTALEAIKVAVGVAAEVITYLWDTFGKTILMAVEAVWGYISNHIKSALDVIGGILNIFIGIFTGDWTRAWDGVKQILRGVWTEIEGIIKLALDSIMIVVSFALDNLKVAWDIAWAVIRTVAEVAIGAVETVIGGLVGWFQTLWDKAIEVGNFFGLIFAPAMYVAEKVIIAIKNALLGAWEWLQTLWDKAVEVAGYFEGAFKIGMETAAGAWDVVSAAAGIVVDILKTVVEWAGKALSPLQKVIDAAAAVKGIITGDIAGKVNPAIGAPANPVFGPGQAAGGPVFKGMTYPVGEKGWELFTPQTNGTIIPHDISSALLAGMAAASSTSSSSLPPIMINIDARGSSDPAAIGRAAEQGVVAALAQYVRAR